MANQKLPNESRESKESKREKERMESEGPSVPANEEEGSSATRPGTRDDTVSQEVEEDTRPGIPSRSDDQ
jgi:hypothetical protein